jgi:hypothetical protein
MLPFAVHYTPAGCYMRTSPGLSTQDLTKLIFSLLFDEARIVCLRDTKCQTRECLA